jgi:hypothetical protein
MESLGTKMIKKKDRSNIMFGRKGIYNVMLKKYYETVDATEKILLGTPKPPKHSKIGGSRNMHPSSMTMKRNAIAGNPASFFPSTNP